VSTGRLKLCMPNNRIQPDQCCCDRQENDRIASYLCSWPSVSRDAPAREQRWAQEPSNRSILSAAPPACVRSPVTLRILVSYRAVTLPFVSTIKLPLVALPPIQSPFLFWVMSDAGA
jgi:hypothetical protein